MDQKIKIYFLQPETSGLHTTLKPTRNPLPWGQGIKKEAGENTGLFL
jgi:hypothetical protein